ncbi:hypothetical protein QNN00_25280 [Bacillus velezensis]|nr:hypothetical protein [Bacillus velezensis]
MIDGVFLVDGGTTGLAFGGGVDNCTVSNVYGHRLGAGAGTVGLYSSGPDLNISNIDFQGYETTFHVGGKKHRMSCLNIKDLLLWHLKIPMLQELMALSSVLSGDRPQEVLNLE